MTVLLCGGGGLGGGPVGGVWRYVLTSCRDVAEAAVGWHAGLLQWHSLRKQVFIPTSKISLGIQQAALSMCSLALIIQSEQLI